MFLILAIVLLVIWVVSFFALHVTGFVIHILIILAVISFIANFFTGRSAN